MEGLLIASSPVEIEAKAEEAGLPRDAHDIALRMFHTLTNRLGKAVSNQRIPSETWPNHRFYFGCSGEEINRLLDGLQARPDIAEVTDHPEASGADQSGLFVRAVESSFTGVLVGHENHQGMLSKNAA